MGNVDQKLHDAIIKYQLDLRRFEAGTRKRVISILADMQKELVGVLANADELTEFTKKRKSEILRQVETIIKEYYRTAQGELALDIDGLVDAQVRVAAKQLESTAVVGTVAALPTEYVMARIAAEALIEGGPVSAWWSKQSIDVTLRVSNAIRQGVAQGETNAQIIGRIKGRNGSIGALDTARHNIAALVQTAMQTVANDAKMRVYSANSDLIKELVWFSAMDGHVCPRCIAMTGRKWKNDEKHSPVGHSVPFNNPPIHWNDRCLLLPVTKSFRDLGIDMDEPQEGERASKYGPVSTRETFDDFLNRQTIEEQNEQLGRGRAQMWRDGKITLAQLIDGTGRELTLAELKAKYDK